MKVWGDVRGGVELARPKYAWKSAVYQLFASQRKVTSMLIVFFNLGAEMTCRCIRVY